ncbi:sulfite exporter TauE/SafE family protein [Companilactobacillus halodurans]|uniref:Probable membrane transporter protein n=1 Tax=Companilactobacillus halodurans TaxID=2584183 RepID=A0A5P0ZWV4_9LACO|nr:sulfite exporter TauE/SafE family protein [Companilactobacillus halodurans]MQS75448.1 sulfite exporter TauE/SafE family protein [Companilactobacillus halodurans]MQS97292.1 sulfite exporter TauE/SafE family protein [Companilactobacillus halodurans]
MTYILVVLIALFGALMRTVFGFGEALVTMPLLALISFNIQTSTALIGALGLLVAVPVAIKYRQHIDWQTLKRLVIGSILGIPVGILIIKLGSPIIIMKILGIFIIIYGIYNLYKLHNPKESKLHLSDKFDYLAGIISGILGASFNSHGVPIVVFGTAKRWDSDKLRGILQGHFVCVGTLVVLSQLSSGMWSLEVVKLLGIIIPLLFVVVPFGNWISQKIDSEHFIQYVYLILIIFGVILMIK